MSDDIIRIEGLVKQFGHFRALNGLDLDGAAWRGTRVPRARRRREVHDDPGPARAGPRVMPARSRSRPRPVEGGPELTARLAYVPGDVSLWPGLTGGECVDILAGVHGGMDPTARAELIERFDLDPTKRARDYSKGNRQKVALVAALASEVDCSSSTSQPRGSIP